MNIVLKKGHYMIHRNLSSNIPIVAVVVVLVRGGTAARFL